MGTPTEGRSTVNGVELAWVTAGDGAGVPLVLAHGYTGSGNDFALSIDTLSRRRRVFVPDHRGHGCSSKTGELDGYSIAQLADDLVTLLEEQLPGPVDLLGHSMGGRVALELVLTRPDLVRSLILMDTSAWSFLPDDPAVRDMMGNFIAAYDPARGFPDSDMRGPEDDLIEQTTPEAWRDRHQELRTGMDPYAFKALGVELFSGPALSVQDRLGEITCPVTVVAGSNDHPLVDQAGALAAAVGRGQFRIIDGAYHSPQLTHREVWEVAVEEHLAAAAG